jgi:hypothetical protein
MWSVLSVTRKAHASFMPELCAWHNVDYPDALGGDSKARCEARGRCVRANAICRPAHGSQVPPRYDLGPAEGGELGQEAAGEPLDPATAARQASSRLPTILRVGCEAPGGSSVIDGIRPRSRHSTHGPGRLARAFKLPWGPDTRVPQVGSTTGRGFLVNRPCQCGGAEEARPGSGGAACPWPVRAWGRL